MRHLWHALVVVLSRPCSRPARPWFPSDQSLHQLRLHQPASLFALPAAYLLALPPISPEIPLLAPGESLLVFFLLRWLLMFARSSVVLVSRGWFHLLLWTLFQLLVYVRWPVALRHAFRLWAAETEGVRRIAPGYSRCRPATRTP